MSEQEPLSGWLTLTQAAAAAGVVRATLSAAAKRGTLKVHRFPDNLPALILDRIREAAGLERADLPSRAPGAPRERGAPRQAIPKRYGRGRLSKKPTDGQLTLFST